MVRRINLYGGPSSGKSTTAAKLFYESKQRNENVEHIQEYIKNWCYQGRNPTGFDQVYIFGKQLYKEETVLKGGVDKLITDSPLFLQCFYASYYNLPGASAILDIAQQFEEMYPSENLVIRRSKAYSPVGRYQNEEESKKIDSLIKEFLVKNSIQYRDIIYEDQYRSTLSPPPPKPAPKNIYINEGSQRVDND